MKNKKQAPLFKLGGRVKAEVYKAKFQAFQAIKYLNVAALKKAKKAVIEIGWIEAAGVNATLAAEIRNGAITRIRPMFCKNCVKEKAVAKADTKELKKVSREALKRVREGGYPVVKLPIPITSARSLDIPIGPIIIIIQWPPDICIIVSLPDGEICMFCLFGPNLCAGPIVVGPAN
jgi:hypothetical protein